MFYLLTGIDPTEECGSGDKDIQSEEMMSCCFSLLAYQTAISTTSRSAGYAVQIAFVTTKGSC